MKRQTHGEQLSEILTALGEHGGKLDAIERRTAAMHESMRRLWESQNEQDKQIARLETKASFVGAAAGAAMALAADWFKSLWGK